MMLYVQIWLHANPKYMVISSTYRDTECTVMLLCCCIDSMSPVGLGNHSNVDFAAVQINDFEKVVI